MAHNIVLLRDLLREHRFSLNFNQETNVTIVCMGTTTKPPFSRIDVWRPHELQREPESYDIKVNPNGAIVGGVSAFLLRWDDIPRLPELWQLEPETPVPIELQFEETADTSEVQITPGFDGTTPEKFMKMLKCLRWVKAMPN